MNKKIILGLGSVLLVSSSLLACGMKCDNKEGMKKECKMKMMKQDRNHYGKNRIIGMVMHLDLTDEQRVKIKELMQNNMKNALRPSDAFSEKDFDKALFIKLSKEKKDNKIQRQADMIESVYKILTPAQKKELKEMLSQRKTKMTQMINR